MMTYKYFKVIDVNDKLNIDLGHRLADNGNPYYFSPNRFELKDGIAPVKKADGSEEQPVVNDPEVELKKEKKIVDFNGYVTAYKTYICKKE
jgi:hypothetical protein